MAHTLRILDRSGHRTLGWGTDTTEEEMVVIREKFDEMIRAGYFATTVTPDVGGGVTGEVTRTFDPDADIVMSPQLQGG